MTFAEKTLDLIDKGQIDEAHKAFICSLNNDNDDMIYSLAEELYSLGFTNMAKQAYEKLLNLYPDADEFRTSLADIAISEGNDDQALEYLSAIKPDSDAYLESLLVAADLYQTQGIFDVSEQKLLKAYQLAPDEPVIQFALAELYYDIKKYREAINFYIKLIKEGITELSQVNLVQRIGISYAEIGKFEQALGYLEQIHPEDMDDDTRFQFAFTHMKLKHYEKALKEFEKLKETSPDYATVYPAIAEIYEQQGKLKEALIALQEGMSVDEFNLQLYFKSALIAEKLGDNELAEKYLIIAIQQDPENATIISELSRLLILEKKHEENIQLLDSYLKDNQVDPLFYWLRGKSYAALENYAKAIDDYKAAMKDLMSSAEFLRDAAQFFREAGLRDLALNCVNEYLKIEHNDVEMAELQEDLLDY
ncbi:tetratricopeptide repeat protein [Ligilactobacillus cholophilus]|uniref:tetratricopeptide repeat protein n=1 Tax=Ligilactobacillus cholophilus TaxID=3050131 RepID=UPI0025B06896|nr:tetratricopeptide repeat protein [Ligilactobacillus cholophilus]